MEPVKHECKGRKQLFGTRNSKMSQTIIFDCLTFSVYCSENVAQQLCLQSFFYIFVQLFFLRFFRTHRYFTLQHHQCHLCRLSPRVGMVTLETPDYNCCHHDDHNSGHHKYGYHHCNQDGGCVSSVPSIAGIRRYCSWICHNCGDI